MEIATGYTRPHLGLVLKLGQYRPIEEVIAMFKPILEREYKVKTTVTYEAPHHIFHDSKTTYALLDGPEKEFKSCTIRVTHTDPEAVVEAFYQYLLQEHTINPEGGVDDTAEFSNFWGRR